MSLSLPQRSPRSAARRLWSSSLVTLRRTPAHSPKSGTTMRLLVLAN